MASPAPDPFFSPSSRPASVRRETTASTPCSICDHPFHNTNDCPAAARILALAHAAPSSQLSPCGHCRSPHHHTITCPRVAGNFAQQEFRLHNLEPFARYVLKTGIPREAPCCEKHSKMDHALLTATIGRVLQNRTLMPMCVDCVEKGQQQFELIFDIELRSSLDTCNCAAFVFDNDVCQWCAVEELDLRRAAYEKRQTRILPHYDYSPTAYLNCACDRIPMGTPKDAAPPALITREVLRCCTGCTGVVNVPLHHLDGETHLACIPGRPSKAVLGEDGLVAASVEGEPVGMGMDEKCFAHPVRTVAQAVVVARRKDSGVRVSGLNGGRGSSPASGQSEMRAQASAGLAAQSLLQASGRFQDATGSGRSESLIAGGRSNDDTNSSARSAWQLSAASGPSGIDGPVKSRKAVGGGHKHKKPAESGLQIPQLKMRATLSRYDDRCAWYAPVAYMAGHLKFKCFKTARYHTET